MNQLVVLVLGAVCCGICCRGQPVTQSPQQSIWKGTSMDALVQQYQHQCREQPTSGACVRVKVLNLVDEVLGQDTFKFNDGVSLVPNGHEGMVKVDVTESGRNSGEGDFMQHLENYVKAHDVVAKAPTSFLQGTTFKFSPRNLDNNELNFSVQLSTEDDNRDTESRGRKSKLKRILVPILVFVLLKAMTLIPLAIGVLSLKAWNALQLSFISFLVSISLAIFQLCKKIATDSATAPVAAHFPIDASHYAAARNFVLAPTHDQPIIADVSTGLGAHSLAYGAYTQS